MIDSSSVVRTRSLPLAGHHRNAGYNGQDAPVLSLVQRATQYAVNAQLRGTCPKPRPFSTMLLPF
jgi:hypothetical protein